MSPRKGVATAIAALGLITLAVLAIRVFYGYSLFNRYGKMRSQVRSIQSGLPTLEPILARSIKAWPQRRVLDELGTLYLDGALAENNFGTEEGREVLLGKGREAFLEEIRRYPAAAEGYYNLGRVYMLFNYPNLTYAAKGREYLRKALFLRPSDEFLNTNSLAVMLGQWNTLDPAEQTDIKMRLKDILDHNENFIPKIRDLWKAGRGPLDDLKKILSADAELWPRLEKYF